MISKQTATGIAIALRSSEPKPESYTNDHSYEIARYQHRKTVLFALDRLRWDGGKDFNVGKFTLLALGERRSEEQVDREILAIMGRPPAARGLRELPMTTDEVLRRAELATFPEPQS